MIAGSIHFAAPWWFLLTPLAFWPLWSERRRPTLAWPAASVSARMPRGMAGWPRGLPLGLRVVACVALLLALARPQGVDGALRVPARGVAIVVALDTSRTMGQADFPSPNGSIRRLDAARRTAARFVTEQPDDLIGLVAFANFPDTTCPPTLDHQFLVQSIASLEPAPAHEAGTNLGDALAWALRDVRAASPARKVVILITDGQNEPGVPRPLDPLAAARLCRELGVSLHVICLREPGDAAASNGIPPILEAMAREAAGSVHSADDEQALQQVFADINKLERSPVRVTVRTRYREWYPVLLIGAIACLATYQLMRLTRWMRLP